MDISEKAIKNHKKLFPEIELENTLDEELMEILLNFNFDEVQEKGIKLPLEKQGTVTRETRFENGLKVQKSIFGDVIDKNYKNSPENQVHIQRFLSDNCFITIQEMV